MVPGQRLPVHVCGDKSICVQRLFNWNTANEWRYFARNIIESMEHYMLPRGFDSSFLQDIAHARAAEAGVADCALLPLNSRNLRLMQTTAIPSTFKSVDNGMLLEFLQI